MSGYAAPQIAIDICFAALNIMVVKLYMKPGHMWRLPIGSANDRVGYTEFTPIHHMNDQRQGCECKCFDLYTSFWDFS